MQPPPTLPQTTAACFHELALHQYFQKFLKSDSSGKTKLLLGSVWMFTVVMYYSSYWCFSLWFSFLWHRCKLTNSVPLVWISTFSHASLILLTGIDYMYRLFFPWWKHLIGYAKMRFFFLEPPQSSSCRHWLTASVYYSLSVSEGIQRACHRSPVSEDLINRTCHIPLHPVPFSELIKAVPICCNYTKHVTIKPCRWLIWVLESIN